MARFLALHHTPRRAMPCERIDTALARAEHWMRACHPHSDAAAGWIGKELYRPYRIVRAVELAATIPVAQLALPKSNGNLPILTNAWHSPIHEEAL